MNRGSVLVVLPRREGPQGFNEAPIHESGKSYRAAARSGQGNHASMRPRFMNRGSTVLRGEIARVPMLLQ